MLIKKEQPQLEVSISWKSAFRIAAAMLLVFGAASGCIGFMVAASM